jgi:hypothetical protein
MGRTWVRITYARPSDMTRLMARLMFLGYFRSADLRYIQSSYFQIFKLYFEIRT